MAALCGALVDLTLTVKRWYWIGLLTSARGLILIGISPIRRERIEVLTTAAFLCETGDTLICVSVGSVIARTTPDAENGGRVAGTKRGCSAEQDWAVGAGSGSLPVNEDEGQLRHPAFIDSHKASIISSVSCSIHSHESAISFDNPVSLQ